MRGRGRARYREQNSPSPSHRPGSDDRWTHASYQSDSTPPVQSQYSHGDCQQRDSPVQSSFSKSTRMPVDGFSPYNAESTSTSTRGASSHVKKQDRCRNRRPDVQVYVPRARRSQGGSDQHAAETSESPLPRSHRQHGATERNHRESEPSSVATVPGQVSTEQHMSESNRPSLAVSKSSPQKSKQKKVDMKRYVPRLPRCSQRNMDKTSDAVTALDDSSGPICDEKKFSDTGKLGNDDTHAADNAHNDPISGEDQDMETNQDKLGHKMETFDNERKSELRNAKCASYEQMPTELSNQGEEQNSENNMKTDSHNHFSTNSMSTNSSIKSHLTCPDPRFKHKEIITEVYTAHQTNTDQQFCDNSKQSENDYIEQIENCDKSMDQEQFISIVSSDKNEDTAENQIKAEFVDMFVDKNIVNTDINESKDKHKDVSNQISDNHEDNQVLVVTVHECNEQDDLTHDSNLNTGNSGNEFMHETHAAFRDQTVDGVNAAERKIPDKIETYLCNEANVISDTIGGKLPNMVGAEISELEKSELQTNMENCEDDKEDIAASILEDFSNITPEKKVNNSENIGYETNNCAENINCVARTNCDIMDNGDNDRVNNESPDQIIDIKSIDVNDTELKHAKDINLKRSYKSKGVVDQSVSITNPQMVDNSDLTNEDIGVDQSEVSETVISGRTPLEEDVDTDSESENEDVTEQLETGKESETKSVSKNSHQSQTEEVDEDSWDAMFDDDGECLDPNALNELTKTVGKVKIQKSKKINYLDYQPKDKTDFDFAQYEHIIEIYDFPAEFVTRDLIMAFQSFMSRGFDLKWVDDTHALGIFNSAIAAQDALGMVHPLLKVCPLSQASRQSKIKAKRCTEFLQPYKPRPETSAAAARRLVAGALGLATNVSREKREKERQQLKEAKAKRRKDRQNREDIWEFGKCAMDDES